MAKDRKLSKAELSELGNQERKNYHSQLIGRLDDHINQSTKSIRTMSTQKTGTSNTGTRKKNTKASLRGRAKNQRNYLERVKNRYEKGGGISLTIPDQTLTLRELVDRYTIGDRALMMSNYREGFYSDEEGPDLNRMTPQEKIDYARSQVNSRKQKIQDQAREEPEHVQEEPAQDPGEAKPPKPPKEEK